MGGAVKGLEWVADFSKSDSAAAGFVDVERQRRRDAHIDREGPPIPVIDAPYDMGRALRLHLADGGKGQHPDDERRLEVLPGGGMRLTEGMRRWFRVNFALEGEQPWDDPPGWGPVINQIHQARTTGSPPVEFVVREQRLTLSGGDGHPDRPPYRVVLKEDMKVGQKYQLVYGVTFSEQASKSWCDVWLDGRPLKENINIPCATIFGGPESYWKGATLYTSPDNAPATMYQNAPRRNHPRSRHGRLKDDQDGKKLSPGSG